MTLQGALVQTSGLGETEVRGCQHVPRELLPGVFPTHVWWLHCLVLWSPCWVGMGHSSGVYQLWGHRCAHCAAASLCCLPQVEWGGRGVSG